MSNRPSVIMKAAIKRDTRIISSAFITMVILAALLVSVSLVAGYLQLYISATKGLSRDVERASNTLAASIEYRTSRGELAAGDEQVRNLARLSYSDAAALTPDRLNRALNFLLARGLTAITIIGDDGVVVHGGTPLPSTTAGFSIINRVPTRLLWSNGFYLQAEYVLRENNGAYLGTMIALQSVPPLNDLFQQDTENGKTNDALLCAPSDDGAACIESRDGKSIFTLSGGADQRLAPVQRSFEGIASSKFWTRTPLGRMLAASHPVGHTGLALIKTIADWEILIPLYIRVGGTIAIISILLILGWLLLRKGLNPLVRSLIAERELATRNEQRFIAASENSLNAFYIFEAVRDEAGKIIDFRFVYINHHAEALIGRSASSVIGKLLCVELPITITGGFFEKYKSVIETGKPINAEILISDVDINASWLYYQVVRLGDGVAITTSDISSRKQTEFALEKAVRFTQAVLDSSSFCTIVVDLDGMIVAVNPAVERMLWYSKSEMVGKMTPLALHDPEELKSRNEQLARESGTPVRPVMDMFLEGPRKGLTYEGRWIFIRKDGSKFPIQLTITGLTDEQGKLTGYMGISYDITERKRQEDYISHLAHHDVLTGLPTRLLFHDRVEVALARVQRYGGKCALMLIDLDNFKDINDSMGHHAGDDVLVVVSKRLTGALRSTDTVSRLGGDEFTVLLDNVESAEDATIAAGKLLAALSEPVFIGEETLTISASIGISVYPEGGTTSEMLLKHADAAMYHAKGAGKHSYLLFTQGLADATTRRLLLESALKKALKAKEFSLVYQPQVSLESGAIMGVEALVRWNNEKLGNVPPSDFISVAEQCGVIGPLGEWVLRTACEEIKHIGVSTGHDLRLAVNISPRQLELEGFAESVARLLKETGFPPRQLEIEITEGVLMNETLLVGEALKKLQSLGLQTAIDDFGVGFSNISYLLKLAVNRIKIDQSFISCMEEDTDCSAVVNSMIGMAGTLGVDVLAEGVETVGQSRILRAQGCQEAQGYYFYRPMSAAALMEVLLAGKASNFDTIMAR